MAGAAIGICDWSNWGTFRPFPRALGFERAEADLRRALDQQAHVERRLLQRARG